MVPESLLLSTPQGKLRGSSYLLAVSTDQGATWRFIDGSGIDKAFLKKLFPTFPAKLKLPEKKEPQVIPAEPAAK